MAAEPWYRESKQAYYVTLNGKQIRLGTDEGEARRQWHALLAGLPTDAAPVSPLLTFADLHAAYLADQQRRVTAATHKEARSYLSPFVKRFGTMHATGIVRRDVEGFISGRKAWGAASKREAATRIVALFNWSVAAGLLATNPITGLQKPQAVSRGASALLDTATHDRLWQAATPTLRPVLTTLHETGCRPSELCHVTVADFNADLGCWLLAKHKTAHTTGKPRIVWLTPPVVALCRELAVEYPTGPLYRNAVGKPWRRDYLASRFRKLRDRLNLPDTLTLYSYRHTFATDALANGVPDAHVAELLGHHGTIMLHKHYSHLLARNEALRQALAKVRTS